MECSQPVSNVRPDGSPFTRRCGTCPPCAISKAAMWTLRIGLESTLHDWCSFVTLTYGQESIPENGSLLKTDVQLFLRRLSQNISKMRTKERSRSTVDLSVPRYYFVGEYGEQSERPHYHAVLFGLGIGAESLIAESWEKKGHIKVDELTPERAAYVARYTQKKSKWQYRPLDGRAQEFSLMSKKPGLGLGTLPRLADTIRRRKAAQGSSFSGNIRFGANLESLWNNGVPESLRYNGKIYPLGPYLRDQLTKMLNQPQKDTVQGQLAQRERQKELNSRSLTDVVISRQKALKRSEYIQRMREIRSKI